MIFVILYTDLVLIQSILKSSEMRWGYMRFLFLSQPSVQGEKGWEFGNSDPLVVQQEQEEAEIFARCIELEELLETTMDIDLKKQLEWEVEELQDQLESLQRKKKQDSK
jgi:hypothetical protein